MSWIFTAIKYSYTFQRCFERIRWEQNRNQVVCWEETMKTQVQGKYL